MGNNTSFTYNTLYKTAWILKRLLICVYSLVGFSIIYLIADKSLAEIAYRVIPYGIPPLFSLLVAAFLSLVVLTLEQPRMETILFGLISAAFFSLNTDIFLLCLVDDPATAITISRIDHFFLVLIMLGASLHLVYLVCDIRPNRILLTMAYGTGVIVAPFTFSSYYLKGLYHYHWGYFASQGILYAMMSMLWMAGILYALYLLVKTYKRTESRRHKETILYLCIGFVLTAILSIANTPALFGYEIYPAGTFTFVPLLFLAYALFRRNIHLAVQELKKFLIALLRLIILLIISFSPWILFHDLSPITRILLGISAAWSVDIPLSRLIKRGLSYFIPDSVERLSNAYISLTRHLTAAHKTEKIFSVVSKWLFSEMAVSKVVLLFSGRGYASFEGWAAQNPNITTGFFTKTNHQNSSFNRVEVPPDHPVVRRLVSEGSDISACAITPDLSDGDHSNSQHTDILCNAGIIVPIFLQNRLYGILAIGDRENNRAYSRHEKEILVNLASLLGPVAENAFLMENLEKEVEKRTRELNLALEETRKKNALIEAKNRIITKNQHILMTLFETGTQAHELDSIDELFSFTLSRLRSLFPEYGFGLILEGGRPELVESTVFIGIPEADQKRIMANRKRLTPENINRLLSHEKGQKNSYLWSMLTMRAGKTYLGEMILYGPPLDPPTARVIGVFVTQVAAIAQNRLLLRRLESLAATDGLTGAANRATFEKELNKAVTRAKKHNIPFSILVIDINNLKKMNDTFGHETGDALIRHVATLLKKVCRETDILARIGGDEFVLILPATSSKDAKRLVKRIREAQKASNLKITDSNGHPVIIPASFSIGLAGTDETDPEETFKTADERMYKEKKSTSR